MTDQWAQEHALQKLAILNQEGTPAPARVPVPPPRRIDTRLLLRKGAHRNRHSILPALLLITVPLTALAAHVARMAWTAPLAGAVLALALGARSWRRTAGWKPRRRIPARVYAVTCGVAGVAWLAWASLAGLGHVARAAWIPLWLVCYLPWWNYIRPHHAHGRQDETPAEIPPDELLERLRERVCGQGAPLAGAPLAGATVEEMAPVTGGRRFLLHLVPGKQTIDTVTGVRKLIASAAQTSLGLVLAEGVPDDDGGERGPEHLAMLTVLEPRHPQKEIQEFAGPTFDPKTGLFDVGPYPDGQMARNRLLKVDENGNPIRAASGLTAGTTGSGKSRYQERKIMEHLACGLFQVVYLDGQGGASIPGLLDYVGWPALRHEEWLLSLRALGRLMVARTRLIASRRLGHWDPALGPFVHVPVEEAQKPLLDPVALRLVKHLLQEGEKTGIGVDLSTQFPSQVELGAGSGTTGANVLRDLAASGNVTLFRTGSEFAKTVTVASIAVSPRDLPRIPGMCYPFGASMREAPARAIRAADPPSWAHTFAPMPFTRYDIEALDGGQGIYTDRMERVSAHLAGPGDGPMDLAGLDAEVALMLGEVTPEAAQRQGKPNCVQVVWDLYRDHGTLTRDALMDELGGRYSASAVDKAIRALKDQGGIRPTGTYGEYERATPLAGVNAGAGDESAGG